MGDLDDLDGEEDGDISHGDSSALLQSDLLDMTESERRMIRHRLRVRLGVVSRNKLVSGKSLHDSLSALGLTRYTEQAGVHRSCCYSVVLVLGDPAATAVSFPMSHETLSRRSTI